MRVAADARFRARLVRAEPDAAGARVVLDRTLFYPTGGGQPTDLGQLGGVEVLEVVEEGEEVVHRLADP
ncbi:MAG TPA: alanyl-tRNA editing protein, partial [Planctomycetes bacterium]|nr:alanyl-tRNA editing protein [Planctomycetota bacterium]